MFAADYDTIVSNVNNTPFSLNLKNTHSVNTTTVNSSTNDSSPVDTIEAGLDKSNTGTTDTSLNGFGGEKFQEYDVNNDFLLNSLLEPPAPIVGNDPGVSSTAAARRFSELAPSSVTKRDFKRSSVDLGNDTAVSNLLQEFNINFNSGVSPREHTRTGSITSAENNNFHVRKFNSRRNNSVSSYLDSNSNYINTLNNLLNFENAILSDDEDDIILKSPKSANSMSSPSADASMQPKFINPSLMLSDKASKAAIVATSGMDTLPHSAPSNTTNPVNININRTTDNTLENNDQELETLFDELGLQFSNMTTIPHLANSMSIKNDPNSYLIPNQLDNSQNLRHTAPVLSRRPKSRSASIPSSAPVSRRRKSSTANSSTSTFNNDPSLKTFKCDNCEKAFRRSEHLKRHIRSVHSTERPFPCNYCEKKFSRSDNLSQHLKTHKKHGDF